MQINLNICKDVIEANYLNENLLKQKIMPEFVCLFHFKSNAKKSIQRSNTISSHKRQKNVRDVFFKIFPLMQKLI